MTLSAKRGGGRCELVVEERNFLLKEGGYLSGVPGNYNLQKKENNSWSRKVMATAMEMR